MTALGAALRLHDLGTLPPGLYQDEAYNGLDALAVLGGAHPIYFPANNGREPLYIYLTALSVSALGRTPAAVRLPAAFAGILTIPATYALGRALFGRRAGLLAAAMCAVTFWPVALSRIGLRAGLLPLLAALSLACAVTGWRGRRMWLVALGGGIYGLSFYSYLAARFSLAALSIFLIFWYIATRGARRDLRRGMPRLYGLAAFAVAAGVVAAPLAAYAAGHPETFAGRLGQVAVWNPAVNEGDLWGTLFNNGLAALGMFVWRGDAIARHNLPGRPVFDPLLGAACVAGVWLCLRRAFGSKRDPAAALALIWTAVMLAPTILAEDTPHFLRAAGVLPFALLFPALALEKVGAWGARRRFIGQGLVAGTLALSLALTVRDYFGRYAAGPNTGYAFQSAATDLALSANRARGAGWTGGWAESPPEADAGAVYVDRRLWDNFTSLRFLIPEGDRAVVLDAAQPPVLPPDEASALYVWPYEDARPVLSRIPAEMIIAVRAGPAARGDLEPEPYFLFSEYRLRPWPPGLMEAWAPWAAFENGIQLHGQAEATGAEVVVTLDWLSGESAAPGKDLQVFAHAVARNEIVDQADGPLGMGLYPSSWWRPRQIIEERRVLHLPPGLAPGEVIIRIGLYDPATEARVPLAGAAGDAVEIILSEPLDQ